MSESTTDELTVDIWRGGEQGEFRRYTVPARASQTVLDVVTHVQRYLDQTLSYRFACRVGMCGSCAMTVNGRPRWTCRTHVDKVAKDGRITIAPLRNLPVIKDLAVDMAPFFDKWTKAEARFLPTDPDSPEFARVSPDSRERQEANAGIECIGCGVCYAACDVVAWNPDYLGPAALNRAWTLVNDARDADPARHLAAVAGDAGCHSCHSQQSCTEHCPKQLNPAASIAGLKRATAKAMLRGEI
ncbi:MAG: succinate dehydrogenase/fumarate reductase iron-sulfur subunit [Acetobacterales bacterium]